MYDVSKNKQLYGVTWSKSTATNEVICPTDGPIVDMNDAFVLFPLETNKQNKGNNNDN